MVSVQYSNKNMEIINMEISINITNVVLYNYRAWKNFMPHINSDINNSFSMNVF